MLETKQNKVLVKSTNKKRILNIATFICGFLLALAFITHDVWIGLILIPLGLYLHKNRPKDIKEQEELEALTWHSFTFTLILPAAIILFFFIYLVLWKVAPAVMQSFYP
jgi:hypothetical protein